MSATSLAASRFFLTGSIQQLARFENGERATVAELKDTLHAYEQGLALAGLGHPPVLSGMARLLAIVPQAEKKLIDPQIANSTFNTLRANHLLPDPRKLHEIRPFFQSQHVAARAEMWPEAGTDIYFAQSRSLFPKAPDEKKADESLDGIKEVNGEKKKKGVKEAPPDVLDVAFQVPGYRIIRQISAVSKRSVVFEAVHLASKKRVALKVYNPIFKQDKNFMLSGVFREASTQSNPRITRTARVDHIGITMGTLPYAVIELLDALLINRESTYLRNIPTKKVIRMLLEAVAELHGEKIIHTDIKPCNLGFTFDGVLKLLDSEYSVLPDDPAILVRTGTPEFSPPEHQPNKEPTPATFQKDVFAVGLVLYNLLSRISIYEVLDQLQKTMQPLVIYPKKLVPLRYTGHAKLTQDLIDFVMKAIQPDPKDRFVDGTEMLEVFSTFEDKIPDGYLLPNKQTSILRGSPRSYATFPAAPR